MKRFAVAELGIAVGLIALSLVAGRKVDEIRGYALAVADTTVDEMSDQIPNAIHDRKLDQDLSQLRQEVIEHNIQLSRLNAQIEQLSAEVRQHEASLARRGQLLAAAYPLLELASREDLSQVQFAGKSFPISNFECEIDELLGMQERESEQLACKQAGLEKLEHSSDEAEMAVWQLNQALDRAEHEIATLKSRREQAEIESRTLELIAAISTDYGVSEQSFARSLERLRDDVRAMEAANNVTRTVLPVSQYGVENELTRDWERLQALELIHHDDSGDRVDSPSSNETVNSTFPLSRTR